MVAARTFGRVRMQATADAGARDSFSSFAGGGGDARLRSHPSLFFRRRRTLLPLNPLSIFQQLGW